MELRHLVTFMNKAVSDPGFPRGGANLKFSGKVHENEEICPKNLTVEPPL